MKLSNKDTAQLQNILSDMKTARKYIMKPQTLICSNVLPNLTSYYNKAGEGITPMTKECGSELCYLFNAIDKLERFLNPVQVEVTEMEF